MKKVKRKPRDKAYRKSLAFFVENDGFFDQQMKSFAEKIILGLTKKLDEPKKGQVAKLLGLQRNRLTRLLNGLGIEKEFEAITYQKETEMRRAHYDGDND